jgi:hypothetical protein
MQLVKRYKLNLKLLISLHRFLQVQTFERRVYPPEPPEIDGFLLEGLGKTSP